MSTLEQSLARAWPAIRRWLMRIHLWIGIAFCIPFAVLGVTGSYLVYDQDFTAPPRATAAGEFKAPSEIIAAATAANPERRVTNLSMPLAAGDPASVRIARPGAERGPRATSQVFVDPVSLEVLDTRDGVRTPLSDFMHSLHGNFLVGGRDGRSIVGWMGVGMTFLGISGLILWWPRNGKWKDALWRKNAKGLVFQRQLHSIVGVLGWVAFIVVSFTGVAISFPQTVSAGMHAMFGGSPPEPRIGDIEPLANTAAITPDQAVATALAKVPDAHLGNLTIPGDADQPYRLTLIANDALAGAPVITAVVDPYRNEVLAVRDPRNFAMGESIMAWQRTLHDGRALGAVWAFLVFLSGLMPPLFAVTGTAMWWMRRQARLRVRSQQHPTGAVGVPAE